MLPKSPDDVEEFLNEHKRGVLSDVARGRSSNEIASAQERHHSGEAHGITSLNHPEFPSSDKAASQAVTESSSQILQDRHNPQAPGPKDTLHSKLKNAMQHIHEKQQFLPISALEHIADETAVAKELSRLNICNEAGYPNLISSILNVKSCKQGIVCSRRKLFAILVLVEKATQIPAFIREEIHDCDLPFSFHKDSSVLSKEPERIIKAFEDHKNWGELHKEEFERRQWWLEAPCFRLSCERDGNLTDVSHCRVDSRAPMPFVSKEKSNPPLGIYGGESTVRKVKFHPGHYNSEDFSAENPFFAIKKRLNLQEDEARMKDNEVQSLKRLNYVKHEHLIRLLATVEHKGYLRLVFPWADVNLQEYWSERFPSRDNPPRNAELAKWMAKQCLGLGGGLKEIHHNHVSEAQSRSHGLSPDAPKKNHGPHGDIKADNILCFKSNSCASSTGFMGTLKIADFGFVDFHSSKSKSKVPSNSHGATHTYMAPEWFIRRDLSPAYDIWCMGCVLLEFVAWYLNGQDGVKSFMDRRLEDSISNVQNYEGDHFFNEIEIVRGEPEAQIKESVRKEFYRLRHDDRCSDFILDLLEYIEYHLLRMMPENRHSCDQLVKNLEIIYNRCVGEDGYCTKRTKKIPEKRTTDLSETNYTQSHAPPNGVSVPTDAFPLSTSKGQSDGSTGTKFREPTSSQNHDPETDVPPTNEHNQSTTDEEAHVPEDAQGGHRSSHDKTQNGLPFTSSPFRPKSNQSDQTSSARNNNVETRNGSSPPAFLKVLTKRISIFFSSCFTGSRRSNINEA